MRGDIVKEASQKEKKERESGARELRKYSEL